MFDCERHTGSVHVATPSGALDTRGGATTPDLPGIGRHITLTRTLACIATNAVRRRCHGREDAQHVPEGHRLPPRRLGRAPYVHSGAVKDRSFGRGCKPLLGSDKTQQPQPTRQLLPLQKFEFYLLKKLQTFGWESSYTSIEVLPKYIFFETDSAWLRPL